VRIRPSFALALLALCAAAPVEAQSLVDVSGAWSLTGQDRQGAYTGRATATQAADGAVVIQLTWVYDADPTKKGAARIEGKLKGLTLRGRRTVDGSVVGSIGGQAGQSWDVTYGVSLGLSPNGHGSRLRGLSGRYDKPHGRDRLADHDPSGGTPPPPPPPPPAGQDTVSAPPQVMAVPGTPEAGWQAVTVRIQGAPAQLRVDGPARLLRGGIPVVTGGAALELPAGEHALKLEGMADGEVTISLQRAGQTVASARSAVTVERLYLLLFGYQGAEVDYLEGDLGKTVQNVVPHLGSGYVRVEDGKSYDQAKIDAAINAPHTPRKVLVDWATTREDLFAYLKRGTVRGISWGSHGYMEPWPGCPDAELDLFESRVWSSAFANPATGDAKNFMREWRDALEASFATHGKLDFVLMHSCCTGGIGSYRDEVWHYINSDTKSRAVARFGEPLPTWDKLRSRVGFLQTYDGPSYFGMWDVSWSSIRNSLQPGR
jgi:hypothetical protein